MNKISGVKVVNLVKSTGRNDTGLNGVKLVNLLRLFVNFKLNKKIPVEEEKILMMMSDNVYIDEWICIYVTECDDVAGRRMMWQEERVESREIN